MLFLLGVILGHTLSLLSFEKLSMLLSVKVSCYLRGPYCIIVVLPYGIYLTLLFFFLSGGETKRQAWI